MTSALYLEHYLDGLEHLPNELQRNFTLMRDLDTRAQIIMKQIDSSATEYMGASIKLENIPEDEKKVKLKSIQDLFNKAKEYGDDKVQLAIQTYEMVDKHIRRLDSDLSRFEMEIHDKTVLSKSEESVGKKGRKKVKDTKASTGKKKRSMSEDELRPSKDKSNIGPGKNSKNKKVNQDKEGRKNQKKNVEVEETSLLEHPQSATEVLDMPVDPNEPTYCLCHQVSYGEMIGCDNSDCSIEWFHFACVGLTLKPKGKWYCPKCTQDRKKK